MRAVESGDLARSRGVGCHSGRVARFRSSASGSFFANAEAARYLTGRGLPLDGAASAKPSRFSTPETQEILTPEQLARGSRTCRVKRSIASNTWCVPRLMERVSGWSAARGLFMGKRETYRGAVLVFRDITARKNRELALESTDQLRDFIYRAISPASCTPPWTAESSTATKRWCGCWDILPWRRCAPFARSNSITIRLQRDELLRRVSASREVREAEVCFRRRDNSRCWALLNIRLLDAQPGQVGGTLVSTVVDITERKLWEETLRQSEERFTAFMRHLPGIAFIKDLTGKYVYYNEASWPQFQKRPEEIVGKTDEDIWPAEDAARHRENDAAVIASRPPGGVCRAGDACGWPALVADLQVSDHRRRQGRAGGRHRNRYHGTPDAGRAAHAGAQNGGARPPCRRRGARFQ